MQKAVEMAWKFDSLGHILYFEQFWTVLLFNLLTPTVDQTGLSRHL